MPTNGEGDPSRYPDPREVDKTSDHSYHEHAEINGVKFDVRWDKMEGNYYEIYFPDKPVDDQVLSISSSKEKAKEVFDLTVQLATGGSKLEEVYQEVKNLINKIMDEEMGE